MHSSSSITPHLVISSRIRISTTVCTLLTLTFWLRFFTEYFILHFIVYTFFFVVKHLNLWCCLTWLPPHQPLIYFWSPLHPPIIPNLHSELSAPLTFHFTSTYHQFHWPYLLFYYSSNFSRTYLQSTVVSIIITFHSWRTFYISSCEAETCHATVYKCELWNSPTRTKSSWHLISRIEIAYPEINSLTVGLSYFLAKTHEISNRVY